jgi:hypothetical protein
LHCRMWNYFEWKRTRLPLNHCAWMNVNKVRLVTNGTWTTRK